MSEDPTVVRLAPKLVNSITRAVHLCESTLAFGKAEEPSPTFSMVRLEMIIADVMDGERLAVGEHDVRFVSNIPPNLMVRADAEQLYRVISNLVRNARQAIMVSGNEAEISVTASETYENWLIEVTDTGPGLPKKAQEHLFMPFQGGVSKGALVWDWQSQKNWSGATADRWNWSAHLLMGLHFVSSYLRVISFSKIFTILRKRGLA